ncbi:hypothetical protein [Terrabacter sp. NPDC080008]|uniref:hypothetical protein n=1 Tax=Terrabacter sp. NPDC080008 TaxID=3155176 RepID=UPI00344BC6C0
MRQTRVGGAVTALATILVAGCTSGGPVVGPTGGASAVAPVPTASLTATGPDVEFTPVDPTAPPPLALPRRLAGEVARVEVTRQGATKAFRVERGEPLVAGRTYSVEAACTASRPSTGTSYAVYDAAPGVYGHGDSIYSQAFPCDGHVHRTSRLGLPPGPVQVDVRDLPPDAVTAYVLIHPE